MSTGGKTGYKGDRSKTFCIWLAKNQVVAGRDSLSAMMTARRAFASSVYNWIFE
jgi:hypothetical protein